MSLKNIAISLSIIIIIVLMIIITSNINQATLASPEGKDLNPLMVSTETITYHDQAALYQGEMANLITNPFDIDDIIKEMNNISCNRRPLSDNSDIITAATHRVRFGGGGVTFYIDRNTGAFWYDYQESIPNKFLVGYSIDNNGQRFASIYQVKDIDELDDLIAALDAAAVNGMTVEYQYTPLDSSGVRCDYLTLDDLATEGAEEKVLADLESTKGLEVNADSAKSVDFVLREKAFGFSSDLISIQALKPNQGGLRPMNEAFTYDASQSGTNVMQTILKWDEDLQATTNAYFKVIVTASDEDSRE